MKTLTIAAAQAILDGLHAASREMLTDHWKTLYGCVPPRHASRALLAGAIGWRCERALQRTPDDLPHLLREVAREGKGTPSRELRRGTQLVREWQGRTYRVTVLEQGFHYQGKTYQSLSAIARHITGTAWSGPAFFGLKR